MTEYPFNLATVREQHTPRNGCLAGFAGPDDIERFPCVIRFIGLCRETLGDARFAFVLLRCRLAAIRIAQYAFRAEAIYDPRHRRIGTEYRFPDSLARLRLAIAHEAAMRGRPCPFRHWQSKL